jgi:hypothetical protein
MATRTDEQLKEISAKLGDLPQRLAAVLQRQQRDAQGRLPPAKLWRS